MANDQLIKDLLRAFFREFLELFYPDVAARLDFTQTTFLDKEMFTDLPQGSRREADLVAQVTTLDGEPEIILIHVEVQTQRRGEFPYRMFEYYALLWLRHKRPIFPLVVYLAPSARAREDGGLVTETYAASLFGEDILTFRYRALGLPDLPADEYVAGENPLAPALSALMRTGRMGRVLRKVTSFRQKSLIETDEARRALLLNVIETYLKLSTEEEAEFQRLLGQPEFAEVRQMITIYEQRGIEQGIEQGMEQGIVRGMRRTLLNLLRARFGELPESVTAWIEAIESAADLDVLSQRVLTAASLEAMRLDEGEASGA